MSTSNLPHQRLDQLPVEVVNEIASSLSLRDLHNLEEAYNFDYSLFDLPGVMKPLNAQEAFSNYDLFLKYRQRYQRKFITHKEIRLALNGGEPQILYDLYREDYITFPSLLATLIIHSQDDFLDKLDLIKLDPQPKVANSSYPILVIASIIYLTWGTYSQIQSFFTKYTLAHFDIDYHNQNMGYTSRSFKQWLNSTLLPVYKSIPLFPYNCSHSEYISLLEVDWLPNFFQQKIRIDQSNSAQRTKISQNLLFLGRDLKLFQEILDFDQNLFTQNEQESLFGYFIREIPILGQPLLTAEFIYWKVDRDYSYVPYIKFVNEEALWLVLEKYEAQILTTVNQQPQLILRILEQTIHIFIILMKHLIASDLTQLFSQLWDFMDHFIFEMIRIRSEMRSSLEQLFTKRINKIDHRRYIQLVDASLSVDNSFFFEECQRRINDLGQIINFLPNNQTNSMNLLEYLFSYHRNIAFDRIKSAIGLDLLAQVSQLSQVSKLTGILTKSFHYGTIINFLIDWKQENYNWNELTKSPGDLDLSDKERIDLTWTTDQPIYEFSDLILVLKSLLPSDDFTSRFFFDFNRQREGTGLFNNLIYTDSTNSLYFLYDEYKQYMLNKLDLDQRNVNHLQSDTVYNILVDINQNLKHQNNFELPVNLTYACLEILKTDSPSSFEYFVGQFKYWYPYIEPERKESAFLVQSSKRSEINKFAAYLKKEDIMLTNRRFRI